MLPAGWEFQHGSESVRIGAVPMGRADGKRSVPWSSDSMQEGRNYVRISLLAGAGSEQVIGTIKPLQKEQLWLRCMQQPM
jgi:hypothetical protein